MTAVSALMAAYNAERYVDETVESIRSQTFADFEFIVIDDGSTDGTLAALERHAAADPRVRLVSRPNRGIVAARNEAIGLARGEFIAVVDADDVSMPDRFALQLAYLRSHPECVAVGSRTLLVDPEGEPLALYKFARSHEEIDAMLLAGEGNGVCHPSSMLRREAVLAVGGYREGLQVGHDHDLFLRLAEHGRLANLPEVLLKYRQHSGSICHRAQERGRADNRAAARAARERRGLPATAGGPVDDAAGPVTDYHRIWAWWALGSGYVRTARKHALRSLRRNPWSVESWRVLACALRGR